MNNNRIDEAAKLAGIAQLATDVRVTIVLPPLSCFAALVLAVALYPATKYPATKVAFLRVHVLYF